MNFFRRLRPRERAFVIVAGVAVLVTVLYMVVIDPLLKRTATLDRQIVNAQRQLKELYTLQQDYLRQKSVIDRINTQLKQQQRNFAIFSRLEEVARQTGVQNKIQSMKPTISPPNDAYREESVEIKMEGVTLEQLIPYLHQVENSPQLLKIKRLDIKPRNDNRQILTVTFRVSVFTLKDETS
jgi:general secretion pathway protein M